MPINRMTTKRLSFQQQQQEQHQSLQHVHHHQQQHQRRPPDVEEALSSMLWTPYERASTTDTSSDDDDELLLQRQLRKSKSQYDYTSVPTTIPPLTPPPLPTITPTQFPNLPPPTATPTNIVAYITTTPAAAAAVAATSFLASTLPSTTSAYYTTEDLCDPSVTTPLVPFSNLMLNAQATARASTPGNNSRRFLNTAINSRYQVPEYDATNEINDDDDDDDEVNVHDTFNVDVYNNDNTLAATSSSNMMMMSSSYHQKNHISYNQPYSHTTSSFGRIPSLTKWWSNSSNTTSIQEPANSHLHSNNFESTSTASASQTRTPSSTQTDETTHNKQPPSYESLYKKSHPSRPLRQRHQRLNKHLNLFKPVLETLKANVTTITQRRFASLTRPDNSNRVTTTDNDTNTTAITTTSTINPSLETAITEMQPANVVRETIQATATITTATAIVTRNENCSTESTTSNNLVHSFTDNFLHEHCPSTQHVAATNVDNEHIINTKNTNNNNNNPTTENINSEIPKQDTLNHQETKTNEEQQLPNETNTKSKQNQENENKQNNNFMICQEQQNKKQLLLLETPINKTNPDEQVAKETCKREPTKMNPTNNDLREPEQIMNNECHSNAPALAPTETLCKTKTNASTLTDLTASLFYDSSSAISLTRSFEASTSYTVGLAYARGSFKTGLQDVRRQQEQQQQQNTYHLTPNKCLAELERLYAEFRASENLREQKLREAQNNRKTTTTTETENMRLNVPANTNTNTSQTEGLKTTEVGGKVISENVTTSRINPSTSSVFLTTTNSVTTITNPCQRSPSLTIQVNQNNNDNTTTNNSNNLNNSSNNNNNTTTNNNINVNNIGSSSQHITNESQQIVLNQAIVNTTTNGVSVINCNYVNNNLNNNNNNNKSITNLCDNATNTTHNLNNNDHYKNFQNISKNHNDINSVTNANSENNNRKNSDNIQNSPTSHSSVPQVLNVNNMKNDRNNDHTDQIMPENDDKHLKNSSSTQVNVIQINEVATKAQNNSSSTTPSSSPRRTFTSTECQTDDISSVQLRSPSATRPPLTSTSSANSSSHTNNRDQRRRERRERRHLQHTASLLVAPTHSHPHPNHPLRHGHLDRHSMPAPPLPPILHPPHLHPGHLSQTGHNVAMLRPMLPDILHNHYPPPYSALPGQSLATAASGSMPHHNGSPIPFSHPHAHPLHPPPQTSTATILGPPPPPPPAGTTLLTSVISTVPIPGATPMVSDGRFTLPLPIMRRSPSERSGKGCCGQWFAGPPLRALIAVVALGGVACALGGAALGATGLAGPPSSHFTAALLMIGVGVVLVTVSAVAWRMTAPGGPPCLGLASSVDLGRCGRRPCSRGGGAPQGLLYPEFQHRPPPPSYQASMQEYRLRLLLLDRDRQNGVVRGSSPPPTYRSHAGSLLRAPLTSTIRGANGGQRCESSIGGSEYSFPPSYRSRNTTPGTISSDRSIETEPSGRLLANEDIPEPLSVEQLSEYNSLQQRCNNNNNNNNTTTSNIGSGQKSEQKRNSVQLDTNILISKSDTNLNNLNSDKKDDLVTIVTITPQQNNENLEANENRANTENVSTASESREQLEILAHL